MKKKEIYFILSQDNKFKKSLKIVNILNKIIENGKSFDQRNIFEASFSIRFKLLGKKISKPFSS